MRKLIAGACILALAATASPALAGGGQGRGGGNSQSSQFASDFRNAMTWSRFRPLFFDNDWGSRGNHFGWFRGKHWGWFKPHNPHWPHHPPASP